MSQTTRDELRKAATSLRQELKRLNVKGPVGTGTTSLFVYCENRKDVAKVPSHWDGIPVNAKYTGAFKPA